MRTNAYPYFDMYFDDGSNISFEHWTNELSVGMHRHNFYELLLIDRGTCRHMFNNVETLLIPGDTVIVASHKEHGFLIHGEVSVYNCQFDLKALGEQVQSALKNGSGFFPTEESFIVPAWEELLANREDYYRKKLFKNNSYEINRNKQGVIHMSPAEYTFVASLLRHAIKIQEKNNKYSTIIKQRCMDIILMEIKQAIDSQRKKYAIYSHAHQKIIAEVIIYIEKHLAEVLNFNALAKKYSFSSNYFRKIFRDVTGFSPVHYVNRLRIVRSCEYIQQENLSVGEAAERVGIYDLDYFSRLFKKIMGSPPTRL